LRPPRRREALGAFFRQNLNSGIENHSDKLGRAGLLGPFSRGNEGVSAIDHRGTRQCE
jgi:hypothetical protein